MSRKRSKEKDVEERKWADLAKDEIGVECSWADTYEELKKMPYEDTGEGHAIVQVFRPMPKEKGGWFWSIVRSISQKFPDLLTASETLSVKFASHPLHSCAMDVLRGTANPPDTMALMVMLIAFSHDVFQVKDVLHHIQNMPSFKPQARELFYMLTSLFFLLWKRKVIPQRIHYQMFYAMKALEDDFLGACGQLALTNEQKRICEHKFADGDVVIIEALAGTGKTTSLVEIVKGNPEMKFLYLAFNKSVQEEGEKKFKKCFLQTRDGHFVQTEDGSKVKQVECKTLHSLAFSHIKKRFSGKLVGAGNLRSNLRNYLDRGDLGVDQFYRLIKNVSKTLAKFFTSTADKVSTDHLPTYIDPKDLIGRQESDEYKRMVLLESRKVWEQMRDEKNDKVKLDHDAYMKLYQLEMKGKQIPGYDCILVDEAQDLTEAFIEVLSTQRVPKVFVGDRHQQIYSFRGAVNAMDYIKPTHVYHLSQSFRFGPDIAYVASCILSTLKHVHAPTILGTMEKGGYCGEVDEAAKPVAIIARYNSTLFAQVVHICDTKPDAKLGFPGGLKSSPLLILEDIHRLDHGQREKIQDKTIKHYETYGGLVKFAFKTEDVELCTRIKIYERFKDKIMPYMEKVRKRAVAYHRADFVFSTAHKIKGLEHPTVKLCDDFFKKDVLEIEDHELVSDECNLLYVAATRAKQCLVLNQKLVSVLAEAKDNFLYLQPRETAAGSDCVINCGRRVRDSLPVCVKRHSFSMWSGKEQAPKIYPEGILCLRCVKERLPHMEGFLY